MEWDKNGIHMSLLRPFEIIDITVSDPFMLEILIILSSLFPFCNHYKLNLNFRNNEKLIIYDDLYFAQAMNCCLWMEPFWKDSAWMR